MEKYLILGCLFLVGCNGPVEQPRADGTVSGHAQEFKLSDGTRCVAWKLGYAGGLDCEFKDRD